MKMNMCSKKQAIKELIYPTPLPPPKKKDDTYYLHTMPTEFQDEDQIVILDKKISDYSLKQHMPQLLAHQKNKRHIHKLQQMLDKVREALLEAAGNPHMFVKESSRDREIEIK